MSFSIVITNCRNSSISQLFLMICKGKTFYFVQKLKFILNYRSHEKSLLFEFVCTYIKFGCEYVSYVIENCVNRFYPVCKLFQEYESKRSPPTTMSDFKMGSKDTSYESTFSNLPSTTDDKQKLAKV